MKKMVSSLFITISMSAFSGAAVANPGILQSSMLPKSISQSIENVIKNHKKYNLSAVGKLSEEKEECADFSGKWIAEG